MTRSQPSSVTLKQSRYKGWDSWHLSQGPLEIVVVPQVGGRIMGMRWRGHDLAFTHQKLEGIIEDVSKVSDVRSRKREIGFRFWGGEKTWLAPQPRWNDNLPFYDLDSGQYAFHVIHHRQDSATVQMISPVCRETGVQITRTITLIRESTEWTVTHSIENHSSQEISWGIWDVAMIQRPGKVYVSTSPSSIFPNGVKTYTEEGESSQVRDQVVGELGSLAVITCTEPKKFKYGVDGDQTDTGTSENGWMLGILDVAGLGLVGYRKSVKVFGDQAYGHGCVAEVFNSDVYPYFEMEIHGPLVTLKPQESFSLEEKQALFEIKRWPEKEEEIKHLALNFNS